jgi:hypothetical protein
MAVVLMAMGGYGAGYLGWQVAVVVEGGLRGFGVACGFEPCTQ